MTVLYYCVKAPFAQALSVTVWDNRHPPYKVDVHPAFWFESVKNDQLALTVSSMLNHMVG